MESPFISVVIPVLDVSSTIAEVLDSLTHQSYPEDRYEVIIVDNGSTDATMEITRGYPFKVLEEEIRSPYAARNRGLKHARGEVIAFTDGNKVPADDWLEKGIGCMQRNAWDLTGGKVEFTFSERKTFGEIFDSITFLDNEKYVKEEKASLGGNLFFKKEVLEAIGDFPAGMRSGMDIYWSRKAVNAGYKIGYCPDAVVFSVARSWRSAIGKSYRVGTGHPVTMANAGRSKAQIVYHILRTLLPPSPLRLYRRIKKSGEPRYVYYFPVLWLMDYGRKLAMAAGRIAGMKDLQ